MNAPDIPIKRSVGRPRDPALEARIKDAGLLVLAKHGFSGLTLDRICTEAAIPKATFYRRWASPEILVSEAYNERFDHALLEDTGDVVHDLRAFARLLMEHYSDPLRGPCLLSIVTETKIRPELQAVFTSAGEERRRRNVSSLETALAAQQLAPSLDAESILHVLNGLAFNSYAVRRPVKLEALDVLISVLLQPTSTGPISDQ